MSTSAPRRPGQGTRDRARPCGTRARPRQPDRDLGNSRANAPTRAPANAPARATPALVHASQGCRLRDIERLPSWSSAWPRARSSHPCTLATGTPPHTRPRGNHQRAGPPAHPAAAPRSRARDCAMRMSLCALAARACVREHACNLHARLQGPRHSPDVVLEQPTLASVHTQRPAPSRRTQPATTFFGNPTHTHAPNGTLSAGVAATLGSAIRKHDPRPT